MNGSHVVGGVAFDAIFALAGAAGIAPAGMLCPKVVIFASTI
jgi:hypothetical protein